MLSREQLEKIANPVPADIGGAQSPIVTQMAIELLSLREQLAELKALNRHFDLSIRKTEGVNEVLRSKLEAAERALIRPLPIGELIHRLEGQTYEKWFGESDVKDLRERAEAAEARLLAPVKLPPRKSAEAESEKHPDMTMYEAMMREGNWNDCIFECEKAIRAAGYPVEGGG